MQCMSLGCAKVATFKVYWDADDGDFNITRQCDTCASRIEAEAKIGEVGDVAFMTPIEQEQGSLPQSVE